MQSSCIEHNAMSMVAPLLACLPIARQYFSPVELDEGNIRGSPSHPIYVLLLSMAGTPI
jgi:hypothetical protein